MHNAAIAIVVRWCSLVLVLWRAGGDPSCARARRERGAHRVREPVQAAVDAAVRARAGRAHAHVRQRGRAAQDT